MTQTHINPRFDEDLAKLDELLLQMGGLLVQQLTEALALFATPRSDGMQDLNARERDIDDLEQQVQNLAIHVAATRQPMAIDLRRIVVAMKISDAFEAIGNHCMNIAVRGKALARAPALYRKRFLHILDLQECATAMLNETIACCREWDKERAIAAWQRDLTLNRLHDALLRDFSLFMTQEPQSVAWVVDFLSAAKYVERLGDRVKSVLEALYYADEGVIFVPPALHSDSGAEGDEEA